MKKAPDSKKDRPHPMLHGQHSGKMPKEVVEAVKKSMKKPAKKKK